MIQGKVCMNRKKLKYSAYVIAMLVTLICFQNCGPAFESLEVLESASTNESEEISDIIVPEEPPVEIPEQPPVEVPEKPPVEIPEKPPIEVPEEPPVEIPEQPPIEVPEEPPVEIPEEPPVEPPTPGGSCTLKEQIFVANNSNTIVIEAENTEMVGKWEKRQPLNGSTGSGIIVYRRSDSPNDRNHSYDGVSELTYNVFVHKAGVYKFSYRGARYKGPFNYTVFGNHDNNNCPSSKNNCTHADLNNDAFVSTSNGLAPTKLFAGVGNSTDNWKIASTFDRNHNKSSAQVNLKAGLNKIFIRGRSTFFAIDKIFIFQGNQPNARADQSDVNCP